MADTGKERSPCKGEDAGSKPVGGTDGPWYADHDMVVYWHEDVCFINGPWRTHAEAAEIVKFLNERERRLESQALSVPNGT